MAKHWKRILFFTVVVTVVSIFLFNQNVSAPGDVEVAKDEVHFGISGFNPQYFPNSSQGEIETFWEEVNDYSRIYGVHVNWNDLQVLKLASDYYNHNVSLVLGFQDPQNWAENVDDLVKTVDSILSEHSKVKYLFIGNEVNLLYLEHRAEFPGFLLAYEKVYQSVSQKYPEVKIGTVFQYDALRNSAKLMPNISKDQFELFNEFNGMMDVVGLTVYPFFNYSTPQEIPESYFLDLQAYVDMPIAVTETGWMSRTSFGEGFEHLVEDGTTGSEQEQVQYLSFLQDLIENDKYKVEFINWAFLNDITEWQDGENSNLDLGLVLFDSVGLRMHSGQEKLIWDEWIKIFLK